LGGDEEFSKRQKQLLNTEANNNEQAFLRPPQINSSMTHKELQNK